MLIVIKIQFAALIIMDAMYLKTISNLHQISGFLSNNKLEAREKACRDRHMHSIWRSFIENDSFTPKDVDTAAGNAAERNAA